MSKQKINHTISHRISHKIASDAPSTLTASDMALNRSSSVSFDETTFALSVKHALNESAQALPQETLDKLYAARRKALSARNSSVHAASPLLMLRRWAQGFLSSLGAPLAFAAPALIVGVGLYVMSSSNADNYVETVAEIDSQVLTQDLPINALLDKGFVRYVQVGE